MRTYPNPISISFSPRISTVTIIYSPVTPPKAKPKNTNNIASSVKEKTNGTKPIKTPINKLATI
uniref:Uncharacterized protein n=1 Tax=Arion vulgaris TaxID=1028688 RepID=A0A0B6YX75_9EUPU